MTNLVQQAVKSSHPKRNFPEFRAGDTIEVFVKVKEGEKERVQLYRGVVIRLQGAASSRSFTVRKISDGVGVERTFPFSSPSLDRVEVIAKGQVRRSKLYYLRDREGKAAKVRSELASIQAAPTEAATDAAPAAPKAEKKKK